MEDTNYKRLTFNDRLVIQTLWGHEGITKTDIARRLNRHKSTICREINRWTKGKNNKYKAQLAHWHAEQQYADKHFKDKLTTNLKLREYVFSNLKDWTPEQIAGRIRLEHPKNQTMRISHEAIYTFIYRHPQGNLNKKLIKLLPQKRSYRRRHYKTRGVSQHKITDTISIDQRPTHVNDRLEIGHWEGDLMIGLKHASAIATLVERTSRATFILKVKDRRTETVTEELRKALCSLPKKLRLSMTYDNGFEMANHKWLTQQTETTIFFAHPYSSWERGTNENTNGLIRRYFPKGTDFNKVTYQQLREVQDKLNNRPRKVLGYRTPLEILKKSFKSIARYYNHQSVNVRK
jgi:transposase, IS30 family